MKDVWCDKIWRRPCHNTHIKSCIFGPRLDIYASVLRSLILTSLIFSCTSIRSNRRIFVYTFCLINICLSLSDDPKKDKNSEYWKGITVSVISENLRPIHQIFSENSLLQTRPFTVNVWLINFFATQQFRNFWWLIFPSILLAKSCKLHKLLNLISSFNFCI